MSSQADIPIFTKDSCHVATQETLLMNANPGAPDDSTTASDVPSSRTSPVTAPHDARIDTPAKSDVPPHVVYQPLPVSRAETARQQRELRRLHRNTTAPTWLKRVGLMFLPGYVASVVMRMHDPDYDEHFEQWKEQQRNNYGQREP